MRIAPHRLPPLLALIALTAALGRSDSDKSDQEKSARRDAELIAAAKDPAVVKSGKATYTALCLACHGAETAQGDSPSNLFDPKWYHGGRPSEIERTVLVGFLEKNMPPWGEVLPPEDTTAVVAFILSQQK